MSITYSYAQEFNTVIKSLKIYDLEKLDSINTKELNSIESRYINAQKKIITLGEFTKINQQNTLDKSKKTSIKQSVLENLIIGDYYLYKEQTQDSLAFNYYIKALNHSTPTGDKVLIAEICKKILDVIYKSRKALNLYPHYLNIYKQYLYDENEKSTYQFHYLNHKAISEQAETIAEFKKGLLLASKAYNTFLEGKYNQAIGLHFNYFKKESDSALYYFLKAEKLLSSKDYQFYNVELFGIYGNLGNIYRNKKKLKTAKAYYLKAESIKIHAHKNIQKVKLYQALSEIDFEQGNLQGAYQYLVQKNRLYESVSEYNKALALNEINIKYQTEKKEKEILQLNNDNLISESKNRRHRNIAIGLGGSLVLGGIIALLLFKNTKRKQKLAEQEKELETQKLATVLKEQELTAIDAMIEGQEKERQRIANDLHDDLGGLMATVKLHFNALMEKQTPELYTKTNALIDEAYNKVRTVAHAKNSGVIAKQGLLKAINEMAEKISASNKLMIEVIDHGLENRLENSLELTIFRIIQELITNVIKHANASDITIHFTNHEDTLNIMVEDNGKGFNPSQITKSNKGMGISSIDKRIAHLNGTMTIESEIKKGTTIIIDIPIA